MDCTLQNRANLKCKPREESNWVGWSTQLYFFGTDSSKGHSCVPIYRGATIVKMLLTTHVHIGLCFKK